MRTEKEIRTNAEKCLRVIEDARADLRRCKRELIELLKSDDPLFDQDIGGIETQWQALLKKGECGT